MGNLCQIFSHVTVTIHASFLTEVASHFVTTQKLAVSAANAHVTVVTLLTGTISHVTILMNVNQARMIVNTRVLTQTGVIGVRA